MLVLDPPLGSLLVFTENEYGGMQEEGSEEDGEQHEDSKDVSKPATSAPANPMAQHLSA